MRKCSKALKKWKDIQKMGEEVEKGAPYFVLCTLFFVLLVLALGHFRGGSQQQVQSTKYKVQKTNLDTLLDILLI
jgi:hypothetical protein